MRVSSKSQITEISDLAYRNFGIYIAEEKQSSFFVKLEKVLQKENLSSLEELYDALNANNPKVTAAFIHSITTSHTFFFREPAHLSDLVSFIREKPQTEYLIWCAASSSGEEPYSIVMTLLEAGIRNFHLIASDINKSVLKHFNQGDYNNNRLEGVSSEIRKKYFKKTNDFTWQISPDLRSYISIKKLNLMDDFSFPETFDYIFCRNVMIYFDEASRHRALETLTKNLKPGGKLFIGHAETLLAHPKNLLKTANSVYERV